MLPSHSSLCKRDIRLHTLLVLTSSTHSVLQYVCDSIEHAMQVLQLLKKKAHCLGRKPEMMTLITYILNRADSEVWDGRYLSQARFMPSTRVTTKGGSRACRTT